MTLARLSDSDRQLALADLSGCATIHASRFRSTFLGYLSLCRLYSIRFVVSVGTGYQCLVCLKFSDVHEYVRDTFPCKCHNVRVHNLMDLKCWCDQLICECDDIPPMCLDLDQLNQIHRALLSIYAALFQIRILQYWDMVMSDRPPSDDPDVRGPETSTTIRLGQYEPP